jgi:ABC-type arginine transport system permease subunit
LASGLNNTFESIFGALGTAIMASIAVTHTNTLLHQGTAALTAQNEGFQFALVVAIVFPALGLFASLLLRPSKPRATVTAERTTTLEAQPDYEPA